VAQGNHTNSFPACLAQRGTPLIDDANSQLLTDDGFASFAPYLFAPAKLSLSRFSVYVDVLAGAGFFEPGSRVGLLRYDLEEQERVRDEVLIPALARHGVELTEDFAFSPAQAVSDLSITAGQATNAALRFRAAGVDRVLFLPSSGVITTVFPIAAEDQGFRPRYGITTAELPANMTANAPDAQLQDALLVGWSLPADRGRELGNEANPEWSYCRDVMREHGALEDGAFGCGPYFFVQAALARAAEISPAGLAAGAAQIGTAPWSTTSYATDIRPGRHDGVSAVVLHRYDPACDCWSAMSETIPAP
jgi:hypothetical protein